MPMCGTSWIQGGVGLPECFTGMNKYLIIPGPVLNTPRMAMEGLASGPEHEPDRGQGHPRQAAHHGPVEPDVLQIGADLVLDLRHQVLVGQLGQAAGDPFADDRVMVLDQVQNGTADPGIQPGLRIRFRFRPRSRTTTAAGRSGELGIGAKASRSTVQPRLWAVGRR